MKKNKKLLLTIITILISITLFPNKANAIVMWMQCVNDPTDVISDEKDFEHYSSFAVINAKNNNVLRNIVYDSTGFYNEKKPTYIMESEHNGHYTSDNFCWYGTKYDKNDPDSHGDFDQCDKTSDYVSISELLNGICPTYLVSFDDHILGEAHSNGILKDMLVMAGKKKASIVETLDDSTLVIYRFKSKEDIEDKIEGIVVEAYRKDGLYGYATKYTTTNEVFNTFNYIISTLRFGKGYTDTLDIKIYSSDLIQPEGSYSGHTGYNGKYMSWEGMTQARRINKYGRNYFKLSDDDIRPWLINTSDYSNVVADERLIYYYDDNNGKLSEWISDWYEENDTMLNKQLEAMSALESTEYVKMIQISKKIEENVNKETKYTFDSDYNASDMVLDLNKAYEKLKIVVDGESSNYSDYNSDCQPIKSNLYDATTSATRKFMCDTFGVRSTKKLSESTNGDMIDTLIFEMIKKAIDKQSGSEISIDNLQSTAEEYAMLFTTAIKYIEQNETLTGEAAKIISELEDKYTEMTRKLGVKVIISCEDLIGDKLREKIKSYLNIVKIVVPILLIMFGIIDFTKAIFSSDEEQMKKAQKNFIKRLGIAILFFLTPTIVDLLLELANKVWTFIEPNSCGIFE